MDYVKIIRPGTEEQFNPRMRATCSRCGCVVEVKLVEFAEKREGDNLPCPMDFCDSIIRGFKKLAQAVAFNGRPIGSSLQQVDLWQTEDRDDI